MDGDSVACGVVKAIGPGVGLTTLRLETNKALGEAIALYRGAGFREVAAFNDDPYAHHWFEKRLRRRS